MKIPRVTVKGGRYYYIQDLEARNASGKPKQKWHKLTRVSDGDVELHKALAALFSNEKPGVGNVPRLIDDFKRWHLQKLAPMVRREYDRMFGIIAHGFERFDVADVIPGDVLDFLAQFDDHPTARGHYKARLSTFFSWCVNKRLIQVNPCREIVLPKPPKAKGRMTDEKFWAIHSKLPPIGKCFLELCYLTRQRPTEIRLLQECDIEGRYIHFRPGKTNKSSGEEVDILITQAISEALERARSLATIKLFPGGTGYLIQTPTGSHYTKSGLNSMWTRARHEAGCDDVTTRHIRPYALNAMKKAGYGLDEIQQSAAHTTRNMTEHYLNQHRDRTSNAHIALPDKT